MENNNRQSQLILIAVAFVIWTIGGIIGLQNGADWFMPEASSVEAEAVDDLFSYMIGIGTFIFLLVQSMLVYSIVRFGIMRDKDDTSEWTTHSRKQHARSYLDNDSSWNCVLSNHC